MLTITRLDDATVEAAGALIAREHTAACRTHPELPNGYRTPAVCIAALQRLRDTGHVGHVAVEHGRTLAVMAAIARGTSAHLPAEGCAVAPDLSDPTTVLARLYGTCALELVASEAHRHILEHVALPPLDEALANLCFGRHHVYATQPARDCPRPADVRIRTGGIDDLGVIARLAQVEIQYRSTPPIFWPPDHRSLDDIAAQHRALLDSGATHLIASLDGRDVGLLTIELTSPSPRLCPDGQPYIGSTATDPDMRGRGVGRALVAAALTLAHDSGYSSVSVDFEPANPLSRPFWLGAGFKPVGYGVLRTIHPAAQPTV
jgi:GNAT superfamily N-acetyltransferase